MDNQVRANVDARVISLGNLLATADDATKADAETLIAQIEAMGEESADAADFEARFAASPMAQEFGVLYGRLYQAQAGAPQGNVAAQAAQAYVGLSAKDKAQAVASDAAAIAQVDAVEAVRDSTRADFIQAESDFRDTEVGAAVDGVRQAVDVAGMFFGRKKKKK